MENTVQKPASDLERIQQSYTTGTQLYVPSKEKTPATRPESQSNSTHGQQLASLALRA
jgi:hypothetical protein